MPLDAARSAFEWLVAGPHPVSVDGRLFPGLPARRVPLNELRDRLLRRRCPQTVRDAVWAHLVLLARTEGGAWTVGAVGVALPALTSIAATLSARFAGDPSDIHAAVLAGFVAELATIDLRRPRVMLRLRWAAYRAGHTAVREALDAPVPSGHGTDGFRSTMPPPPWGHPDFVLARAVAEQAITAAEAELIGSTRLEGVPLADAAAERNLSYQAAKKARQRAEHRLVAYLLDTTLDIAHAGPKKRRPGVPGHRRGDHHHRRRSPDSTRRILTHCHSTWDTHGKENRRSHVPAGPIFRSSGAREDTSHPRAHHLSAHATAAGAAPATAHGTALSAAAVGHDSGSVAMRLTRTPTRPRNHRRPGDRRPFRGVDPGRREVASRAHAPVCPGPRQPASNSSALPISDAPGVLRRRIRRRVLQIALVVADLVVVMLLASSAVAHADGRDGAVVLAVVATVDEVLSNIRTG